MTYRESYMQLNSIDEILAEAKRDIIVAAVINPDRVKVIKRAAEDAINEKFGTGGQQNEQRIRA